LATNSEEKLSSFTIGFLEEESDERQYAQLVADTFQTNHHESLLTYNNACALLPNSPQFCLDIIHQSLKPKGKLILTVPFILPIHN
jgi:asparagine synthetase B (glutamine-hydrolysing)